MKTTSALLLSLGLVGGILGCAPSRAGDPTAAAPRAEAPAVTVLHNTNQCGAQFIRPTALWIDNADRLAQVYRGFPVLPPPAPPTVDFSRQGVLLISMGQRPTAGYGLDLAPAAARLRDGVLEIGVDWQEPGPGGMAAQVVTTPCLLLQLPAVSFQRIQVVDRQGQTRLSADR